EVHCGHFRTVTGHSDESHQPLSPRLDDRLERATRAQRGAPFSFIDEVMQLDQVDMIDTQPLERSMKTRAGAIVGAIAGLGGEEEVLAMLPHPGADSQLRLAVCGGRVDMVDAIFEQRLEDAIRAILLHSAQRGGAEDYPRAWMSSASEWNLVDHRFTFAASLIRF